MTMGLFSLEFDRLPPQTASCHRLDTPPALRLNGPEHGWINLILDGNESCFATITMSDLYPPLTDLWLWSQAIAWGLTPVAVQINEEATYVRFCAQRLPGSDLRLTLLRTHWSQQLKAIDETPVIECVSWQEPRTAFLRRWGRMWGEFLQRDEFDDETQWKENPEPMRDMPWAILADTPEVEPPPWPMAARVAWFCLSMAHHLRSRGHGCDWTTFPARRVMHEMAVASLCLDAAEAATQTLGIPVPPSSDAWGLIQQAQRLARVDFNPDDEDKKRALEHTYFNAMESVFQCIADTEEVCLPHLPITPGSAFVDARGRRASVISTKGRNWILAWDDDRITLDDIFHAGRFPSWRWPVAQGPAFDRDRLDAIDARRLRFLELDASPLGIVCPVCGYPCLDDDVDEVSSCDFCGFPELWRLTYGNTPALDAVTDESGEAVVHTLRQMRAFFLDHGDALPLDHDEAPDDPVLVSVLRHPQHQRFALAAMAEWDAWLENPDPDHVPKAVWQRWNAWESRQSNDGGGDA